MATLKLAIFGGNEALIDPGEGGLVLTVFGGTALQHPTLAARIRRRLLEHKSGRPQKRPHTIVISVMGGTSVQYPLVASELVEMMQLRESGLASEVELLAIAHEILDEESSGSVSFISIFGGVGIERHKIDLERAALRTAVEAGLLAAKFENVLHNASRGSHDGRTMAVRFLAADACAGDPYRIPAIRAGRRDMDAVQDSSGSVRPAVRAAPESATSRPIPAELKFPSTS